MLFFISLYKIQIYYCITIVYNILYCCVTLPTLLWLYIYLQPSLKTTGSTWELPVSASSVNRPKAMIDSEKVYRVFCCSNEATISVYWSMLCVNTLLIF
ncbi:hypothetical protein EB796_001961 [Bugula neritina]|uniref:Uncharacterized protein n=1 Tax=Bugula neritina TaxID=10212 RepID=A0A7J7KNK9_BUGNE|nr:hypothetical protein EB796_001961 [Bugula neritina]